MEFNFASSPSSSSNQAVFSIGTYFDNSSESSSPGSPKHVNNMMITNPMSFDVYPYQLTSTTYFPPLPDQGTTAFPSSVDLEGKGRYRRRSTDSTKSSTDKDTAPNMHLRRRAQNRASQRAFRERKERHVKGLENQLEDLHEKHQDLLESYNKQATELSKLTAHVSELTLELSSLRTHEDIAFREVLLPDKHDKLDRFDKFDAFSSTTLVYNTRDCFFGQDTANSHEDFLLDPLEDSL